MAELEASVEDRSVTAAERAGFFARKCQWVGRRNAPDHVFSRGDRGTVWIEFKRPDDDVEVPLRQKLEHDRMRAAGMEVHVCWTFEEAMKVLGI